MHIRNIYCHLHIFSTVYIDLHFLVFIFDAMMKKSEGQTSLTQTYQALNVFPLGVERVFDPVLDRGY